MRPRRQQFGDILHQVRWIEGRCIHRNVARFHPREIEHVVQEVQQPRSRLPDRASIIALRRRQLRLLQQRRHAENAIQRRAYLVAHRRRETLRRIRRLVHIRRRQPQPAHRRRHPPAPSGLIHDLRSNLRRRQFKRRPHALDESRQRTRARNPPAGVNHQRHTRPPTRHSGKRHARTFGRNSIVTRCVWHGRETAPPGSTGD